jgi:hypothetical protein
MEADMKASYEDRDEQARREQSAVVTAAAHSVAAKDLLGIGAGDKGEKVLVLQKFLNQRGYLSLADQSGTIVEIAADPFAIKQPAAPPSPRPPAKPAPAGVLGTMDEATLVALRTYQRRHGINDTGVVDESTVDVLAAPHCGTPDRPYESQGTTRQVILPDGSVVVVQAFTVADRWSRTDLTFSIANTTPDLGDDINVIRAAFLEAFGMWSAVCNLRFVEVPTGGDIVLTFTASGLVPSFFDGPSRTLARAYYPNSLIWGGDVFFDEAESWSTSLPTPAGRFDLVTLAAHEIGHAIGLDHSAVPGAIMRPSFSSVAQRTLHEDDVRGAQFLYGTRVPMRLAGTAAPAVVVQPNGTMAMFFVAVDGRVRRREQTVLEGRPDQWTPLGRLGDRAFQGGLSVIRNADGRLELFGRALDNAIYNAWQHTPNGGWSDWQHQGGVKIADPAVGINADSRLEIVAPGTDSQIWTKAQGIFLGGRVWPPTWWRHDPTPSLGSILGGAAIASDAGGRLHLFGRAASNGVFERAQVTPGSGWNTWAAIGGGQTLAVPAACLAPDGRLLVAVHGTDGAAWIVQQTAPNGPWGGWTPLGGRLGAGASICLMNTPAGTDLFARFIDSTLQWCRRTSPTGGWEDWVPLGGPIATDPGAALTPSGRVEVFALDADDGIFHRAQTRRGAF